MLDSYDMPMLDYPNDLDIQMHPSTSDQWLQDEAKMEEDGTYPPPKNDYEVDMEAFADDQNIEYDMLDDDEAHKSGPDVVDVEVFDVSSVQSPATVNVDVPYEHGPADVTSFQDTHSHPFLHEGSSSMSPSLLPADTEAGIQSAEHATEFRDGVEASTTYETQSEAIEQSTRQGEESEAAHAELHDFHELGPKSDLSSLNDPGQNAPESSIKHQDVNTTTHDRDAVTSENHSLVNEAHLLPEKRVAVPFQDEHSEDSDVLASGESQLGEVVEVIQVAKTGAATVLPQSEQNSVRLQEESNSEHETEDRGEKFDDSTAVQPTSTHVDDPHEISEGVYIDPPPPVLLTFRTENPLGFCLFNEARGQEVDPAIESTRQVLLQQFPTLYYEPLSAVFNALRQDEYVQSNFNLVDGELILEAMELQLIISEDNTYTADISLHDLNVLHDSAGIGGLLHMRLSSTTPRFITRYQHLQEHVSRLHLEQLPEQHATELISVAEALQEVYREPDLLSEPERRITSNSSQSSEAEDPDAPKAGTRSHTDSHDGTSKSPVQVLLERRFSVSSSSAGKEHQVDSVGKREEVRPSQQGEKEAPQPDGMSSNNSLPAEHISSLDDVLEDHYIEDDTLRLETAELPVNDENDDSHSGADQTALAEDAAPQNALDEGKDEAGSEETSLDANQDTGHYLDENVDAGEPTLLIASPEAEGSATLEGINDTEELYDSAEVEGPLDVQAHNNLEETVGSDYFSDNDEGESNDEQGASNEDRLPLAAEPEEELWEEDLDTATDFATKWDEEHETTLSQSNQSSATLSSGTSKRSFDEFEAADDLYNEETGHWNPPGSPDSKRSRVE